jgi:NTP pyrophosphatase (non-canonical NTP hydrolase)
VSTINYWCQKAHQLAKDKGWYAVEPHPATRLALIHSEVSELLEAERRSVPDHVTPEGKPEGPASEAADVFLRLADYCAWRGIDLESAVEKKHEYNKIRKHRHGGLPF